MKEWFSKSYKAKGEIFWNVTIWREQHEDFERIQTVALGPRREENGHVWQYLNKYTMHIY